MDLQAIERSLQDELDELTARLRRQDDTAAGETPPADLYDAAQALEHREHQQLTAARSDGDRRRDDQGPCLSQAHFVRQRGQQAASQLDRGVEDGGSPGLRQNGPHAAAGGVDARTADREPVHACSERVRALDPDPQDRGRQPHLEPAAALLRAQTPLSGGDPPARV